MGYITKLAPIVLAAGISSCNTPAPKTLMDYDAEHIFLLPLPNEEGVVSVLQNDIGCSKAVVTMDRFGYKISCDEHHYFEYSILSSDTLLKWGNLRYADVNFIANEAAALIKGDCLDGIVYAVTPNNELGFLSDDLLEVTDQVKREYTEGLSILQQQKVHQAWQLRWLGDKNKCPE